MTEEVVKARKGGAPSRRTLYKIIASGAPRVIKYLKDVVDGKQRSDPTRMGAARTLLGKVLPDMKATELTGKDGEQFEIQLIKDYLHVSKHKGDVSPPTGSVEGSS